MTDSTRLTDSTPNHRAEPYTVAPETAPASTRVTRTETHAKPTRRLSRFVVALMCVIAAGAFAISADSWIKLAELAGFIASLTIADSGIVLRLAWVLPVVVDAYTALTTWLYFGARVGSELRKYAGWSAFAAAALSVIAQGALHGLTALNINVQQVWPLVVAVGGIPPVLLGSVIHLLATYLAEHRQPVVQEKPRATYSPRAVDAHRPKQTSSRVAETVRANTTPAVAAPPRPRPASPETPAATQRLAAVRNADEPEAPQATDEQIADAIRDHVLEARRLGVEPGQREMVRLVREATRLSVGQKRCVRIAKTITDSPAESTDDKEDSSDRQLAHLTA